LIISYIATNIFYCTTYCATMSKTCFDTQVMNVTISKLLQLLEFFFILITGKNIR